MATILLSDYMPIGDNQLLKIKLINSSTFIFGRIYMIGGVQAYQPAFTPSNVASIQVIKDLEVYKLNNRDFKNITDLRVYGHEVESIEIVNVADL